MNPDTVPPVHLIGCGAVGSAAALALAKMGVQNVTLYDFDIIEEHNISNQMFSISDVGKLKTEALQNLVLDNTGIKYDIVSERIKRGRKFNGIVMVLTDSMTSRKDIYRTQKNNYQCVGILETRQGIWDSRVYYVNPNEPSHAKPYSESLGDVKKIDAMPEITSACGSRDDIYPTSVFTTAMLMIKFIRLIDVLEGKEDEIINESIFAFKHNFISMESSW